MKIIVGLGNPGQEYSATRHNTGFMAIDKLAGRWAVTAWRERYNAAVAEYRGEETVLLVKPQTFMNLSGRAIVPLAAFYKVPYEDIIVIYDDLDLPAGRLRLRLKGGSGGHRGIESLLFESGKDDFARIRIGIGRPPEGWETANYVLGRFSPEEASAMNQAISQAADAVECIIKEGFNKAMNKFNKG
ncbi:Peptidyl-tRNA hydrolase [Sporomusa ovata DSM 2662]|uniref:Peptidyl-tRNA hydrolase n=1 Tax=Sporomusa ovata TaxID=2378 RepID=A0A0U1KZJ7_9FIRM|nr:aminoacyl-tRNA hydrolase [Sporomusa ovata]EQB27906.1 peptidyl-tRNA hydrolase [Sporomusa ovata DSM 2662]CQR72841.1 Peptidyl-tRNA hydrolase [Sporomusa ovata]